MFRKRSDSEMKPLSWLIFSGFALASAAVIIMSYLAYSRLVNLKNMVNLETRPSRYLENLDDVMVDADQA